MSAWKTAAEESALADLPRGAGVSRVESRLRIAARDSVCPTKRRPIEARPSRRWPRFATRRLRQWSEESVPGRPLRLPEYASKKYTSCKMFVVPDVSGDHVMPASVRFNDRAGIADYESDS